MLGPFGPVPKRQDHGLCSCVPVSLLGVYLNPDDIQKDIENRGFLNVRNYGVETTREEVLAFFMNSTLLKEAGLVEKPCPY